MNEDVQIEVDETEDIITDNDNEDVETENNLTEEDVVKQEMPTQKSEITKEDVEEFKKNAELNDIFMRRTITIPGKRKQRAVFRDEEEIIGDESGEIETFGSLKRKEYELLSDSAKASKPKVLYGRVDGIEEIELGNMKIPTAVCHLVTDKRADINTDREMNSGIYKIVIPAPMFFYYEQEDYTSEEAYATLKRKMDMRVGSIAEFVVFDINMDDEKVLASRISAMQILSYDNYLGKNARIKPGVKAKGYITYINSSGVSVDVMGAECFINFTELSWKYIRNPLNEKKTFYIGKPVAVRIKSVDTASHKVFDREYPYVKISASIKDATENPNKLFYEKYIQGQKYRGQIGYRLVTGEYIVNLGSDGDGIDGSRATCICKAPSIELGGTPYVGQNCMIAITDKDDKSYKFRGAFTYLES